MRLPFSFGLACAVAGACGGTSTTIPGSEAGADASMNDGASSDGSMTSDGPTGDSGGGACMGGGACAMLLTCCNNACINKDNDPLNCGGCGIRCGGSTPMCEAGKCIAQTCQPSCGDGEVCCDVPGPGPTGAPKCYMGVTCPVGCPACN